MGPRYGLYFNSPQSAFELCGVVTATIESLSTPPPIAPGAPPPVPPRRATQPQGELGNSVALAFGGRSSTIQDVPDDFIPPAAPPPPSSKAEAKRRSLAHFRDVEEMVMRATKLSDDFTLEAAVAVQLENIKGRKGAPPVPSRSPLAAVSEHGSPRTPGGAPPALPPRVHPTEESPYDIDGHRSIARPAAVLHKLHVSYDEDLARFVGLPPEWRDMNVQFGVPLARVPRKAVPGYRERIPCILQMMKEYLFQNGGQHVVGIFRLAPDKDECAAVKAQLNSGTFEGCSDVNIIANLIKVWFRELPECLFDVIPEQTIYRVVDMPVRCCVLCVLKRFSSSHLALLPMQQLDNVAAEIEKIPEPSRSMTEWLLDLMAEIVIFEHENKMNAKNMGAFCGGGIAFCCCR